MEDLYIKTKNLMKKYNISANKSLGQNFLINEEIVTNIVEKSEVNDTNLVIEIGPGLGSLTEQLLQRARRVVGIELDTRMIHILKDRFEHSSNFEIQNEDILKVNLKGLIEEQRKKDEKIEKVKVVANLPYYITTPIIMKLLEEKLDIESITVMVQKEVANRLCQIPGKKDTGAITYAVYYYSECEKVINVPKESFVPNPEVESCVIKLTLRREPIVKPINEELFFKIIKASFMQRRKTLINGLTNSRIIEDKEKLKMILNKLSIDEKVRGESLTIEQFTMLADEINKTIYLECNDK